MGQINMRAKGLRTPVTCRGPCVTTAAAGMHTLYNKYCIYQRNMDTTLFSYEKSIETVENTD